MKTQTWVIGLALFVALAVSALPVGAQQATEGSGTIQITGTLSVIWGDPQPGSNQPPQYQYWLADNQAVAVYQLQLTPEQVSAAGGLVNLNRATVTVVGRSMRQNLPLIAVESITRVQSPATDTTFARSTAKPYVWILCRFGGNSSTPEPVSWFQTQATGGYPSLDNYWRQSSFNNIDLTGSTVVGWFNLPHPRSTYVYDMDSDGDVEADLGHLLDDAIVLADPSVYFPTYIGMNLIFNDTLDWAAWGGGTTKTLDGVTRGWGVTWMPPWGWQTQGVLAHEMGHALGMPHSSGPYSATYDSQWDVMSAATGTGVLTDATYGTLGEHPGIYQKDHVGWVWSGHKYEINTATPAVGTFWLNDIVVVPPAGRYLMGRVAWPSDTSKSYIFERRRFNGYDQNVADEVVVIHSVDETRDKPANVVDPDGNGNCNDESARWDPGEIFTDTSRGIMMMVEQSDASGSLITFTNKARSTVYVDWSNGGYEDGSSTYPWNTVWEGQGAVYPGGTVYIEPGTYLQNMTIRKNPITLRRWGSSGSVVIGD